MRHETKKREGGRIMKWKSLNRSPDQAKHLGVPHLSRQKQKQKTGGSSLKKIQEETQYLTFTVPPV